jgi:hypothetical protein
MRKIIILLSLCINDISSQDIIINEIMSKNQSTLFDEDEDTPDWIEIYNSSSDLVSLEDWSLTDDINQLNKWSFPDLIINPNDFLLIMASGKNKKVVIQDWETVIDWGDEFYYFQGVDKPPNNWNQPGFDASSWQTGFSGFGSGDNDDATLLDSLTSLYIVKQFDVESLDRILKVALNIDYDDAFVAYLNGIEIARENIGIKGIEPHYDQGADEDYEAKIYNGQAPSLFWVDTFNNLLFEGQNTLSIQIHNYNGLGSELLSSFNNSETNPWDFFDYSESNIIDTLFNSIGSGQVRSNKLNANTTSVYKIVCELTLHSGSATLRSSWHEGSYEPGDFYTGVTQPNLVSGVNVYYVNFSSTNRDFLWFTGTYNASISDLKISVKEVKDDPENYDLSCIPFFSLGRDSISSISSINLELLNLPTSFLHTNFKINSNGEMIILSKPNNNISDSIYTSILPNDISIGRLNQGSELGFFNNPSPGLENGSEIIDGFLSLPIISQNSGYYQNSLSLSINSLDEESEIYYTTDGTDPSIESYIFSEPIIIDSNTVVKAIAHKLGWLNSPINTQTYILSDQQYSSASIFLTIDPDSMFGYELGIYSMGPNASQEFPYLFANFWEDWERKIHFGLLENDDRYFESQAGVKIFGNYSRGHAQKSLAFYARGIYGSNEFNYPFFEQRSLQNYENFILRNSGSDWKKSMIRDAFMMNLISDLDLDFQAYKPVLTYINGDFWGLYNMREKINEHFIANHHSISPDEIDLLENNAEIIHGTNENYLSLINLLEHTTMSDTNTFDIMSQWIDIDNHINYNIAQIFYDNRDWPRGNIKFWRKKGQEELWRWILYDTDVSFGFNALNDSTNNYDYNTLMYATDPNSDIYMNPPWATFLLRKLLENPVYKARFINLFCDHLNTIFSPNLILGELTNFEENIQNIIPIHQDRWPESAQDWESQIEIMRKFAMNRKEYVYSHIKEYFNLTELKNITMDVQPPQSGYIEINSVQPNDFPWSGQYFSDIPIKLQANAINGFRFIGWDNYIDSNATISLTINDTFRITALFEQIEEVSNSIIINEINYKSSIISNSEDWIELYNPNQINMDISGWSIKDNNNNNNFYFPNETSLGPNEYLICAKNIDQFISVFPDVVNIIGSFDFGLSNNGDQIRLFDSDNQLIDSLEYQTFFPWPDANSENTIELIDPLEDNTIPNNWLVSLINNGTPGSVNSVSTMQSINGDNNLPEFFNLYQNYPNPFNNFTTIKYDMVAKGDLNIKIFDLEGRLVKSFVYNNQLPGYKKLSWDGTNNYGLKLSSGIYFYIMQIANYKKMKKMIILK